MGELLNVVAQRHPDRLGHRPAVAGRVDHQIVRFAIRVNGDLHRAREALRGHARSQPVGGKQRAVLGLDDARPRTRRCRAETRGHARLDDRINGKVGAQPARTGQPGMLPPAPVVAPPAPVVAPPAPAFAPPAPVVSPPAPVAAPPAPPAAPDAPPMATGVAREAPQPPAHTTAAIPSIHARPIPRIPTPRQRTITRPDADAQLDRS